MCSKTFPAIFRPGSISTVFARAREVFTASIKQVRDTRVGDTITHEKKPCDAPLPGFKPSVPVVFCGLFPVDAANFEDLRERKAQERRENARRKEQIRQAEKRIEQLEQERDELESLFSGDAAPSDYERYAVVLQEIDDAYALYLELAEG
mgnify:CR=1 FL=1